MPATANERLQGATIGHAVDLHQYSNGVVRRMIGLLNRVDGDLAAALETALGQLDPSEFTVDRLEGLLLSVRTLNASAYAAVSGALETELRDLAAHEVGYQGQLFESVLPPQLRVSVGIAAVNADQVYAAAMARPFQGRLLREWASSIEAGRLQRVRDQVRIGYVAQEPVADIVRRIRGTRALGYSDGVLEISRRETEAVVRTAISHTAGFARDRFYEANGDLLQAQVWTSTLDSRTSEICMLRDGKQYEPAPPYRPIGHRLQWLGGPGRAHWNCRSTAVPLLKPWRALGAHAAELDPAERASMDGAVPADLTFGDWLRQQSAGRQDEILGATRGALLRRGGLTLDRFANDKGKWLTLDQLRERDAAAFSRAGL